MNNIMENNFNMSEYEKAMHEMYIEYAILAKKENKSEMDWLTLNDLRHSLAKDGWFEVERKRKEDKTKPWVITPKDTEEQRRRDTVWKPFVDMYNEVSTFIKSYTGANENRSIMYKMFEGAKQCDEFINGVVKFSEKKQHHYRVPRQIDEPSTECIKAIGIVYGMMNKMNDVASFGDKIAKSVFLKQVDGGIRIVIPFGISKDANNTHDCEISESEAKDVLSQINPAGNVKLSKSIHSTITNGNQIGNDFYYSELRSVVCDQYGNKPECWTYDSYYTDIIF